MPGDRLLAIGNRRLAALQVYRAIAALSVLLLHVNGKFLAPHYYGARAWGTFLWGRVGVDFFFVLSGFIVTQVVARKPTPANFLYNRFVRIYPPFWLAFGVTLLIAILWADDLHSPVNLALKTLTLAALLIPQDIDAAPVLGVAWTLHHEILFYLVMGIALIRPRVSLALAAILLVGSLFGSSEFPGSFLFSPLHWEFLLGYAVSRWGVSWIPPQWARPLLGVAALGLVAACVGYDLGFAPLQTNLARVGIFGVLFAVLIGTSVVAERERPMFGGRIGAAMASLGDSSYVLYLWHVPLTTVFTKLAFHFFPAAHGGEIIYLTLAIAAAVALEAHAIHIVAERPLVNFSRRVAIELGRLWQAVRIEPR